VIRYADLVHAHRQITNFVSTLLLLLLLPPPPQPPLHYLNNHCSIEKALPPDKHDSGLAVQLRSTSNITGWAVRDTPY